MLLAEQLNVGQEGIWHLLHGEHHMKCQEVTNRMEDDLWNIQKLFS